MCPWQTRISSLFQGHVRILLHPALGLLDQLLMSSSAKGLTRAGAAHALGGECWCPADLDGCQPPAQAVPPGWRLWTPKHAPGKHRGFPRPQSRAPGSCWAQAPHGPAPAAGRSRVSPSPCGKGPLSQGPLVPMHRALWLEAELGRSGRCLPLPVSPSQESPKARDPGLSICLPGQLGSSLNSQLLTDRSCFLFPSSRLTRARGCRASCSSTESWFKPSRQLGPTQPLAQSAPPPRWDGAGESEKNLKLVG